jgi:hypothetical protein
MLQDLLEVLKKQREERQLQKDGDMKISLLTLDYNNKGENDK